MAQHVIPISDIMKSNIDTILNSDYDLGSNENYSGISITERPSTCIVDIECKIHGRTKETDEDFSFEPYSITKLVIDQQFGLNYSDNISLVLTLTPMQLLSMLDNYRDLKCTILIKPREIETEYIDDTTLYLDKTYLVLLKDKELRKRLPKKAIVPDTLLDKNNEHSDQMFDNVEVQLITESEYLLRKKQFNFIARDTTVKDVILFIAQSCDIPQVCMTEPDNTKTYTNIVIPPRHTFSTCMDFLQNYYGIYNKGLSYYYMDDTLYVYPAYETQPTTPESAHLYYGGQNAFLGNKIYHAMSDDIAHVVINTTPVIKDLIDGGIENYGNAISFQHSDRIVDLISTIGEGSSSAAAKIGLGALDIKEPNTSIFAFESTDSGISEDVYSERFQFDDANSYKYKSELYGFRRTILATSWQNAVLTIFKPGYLLHWHYDGEDTSRQQVSEEYAAATEDGELQVDYVEPTYSDSSEYMSRDGICESVTYTFLMAGARTAKRHYYACTADMILSLQYEPAKVEEETTTTTDNTSIIDTGTSGGLLNIVSSFWDL